MTECSPRFRSLRSVHPLRTRALWPLIATVHSAMEDTGYVRIGDQIFFARWVGLTPAPRIGEYVVAVLVDRSRASAPLLCRPCERLRPYD